MSGKKMRAWTRILDLVTAPRVLVTLSALCLAACASPTPPPKDGPDWDQFVLSSRYTLKAGEGLKPGETACLKLQGGSKEASVNEVVVEALSSELRGLGVQVAERDCSATVLFNIADLVLERKARRFTFLTKEAIARSFSKGGGLGISGTDQASSQRQTTTGTFDLTPFTLLNRTVSVGGTGVNAGVGAAGLGLLLDATGVNSWFNEAVSGDPRGYCGGANCRFWDHHYSGARIVGTVQRAGFADATFDTRINLITRNDAELDKLFKLVWSDFSRSLASQPLEPMEALIPGQLIGTFDKIPYTGNEPISTRSAKVYRGADALATK